MLIGDSQIELPYDNNIIDLNKYANVDMTIKIDNGKVRVIESDCNDKICVNFGEIYECNQSIVCLPNRIAIKIDCSDLK